MWSIYRPRPHCQLLPHTLLRIDGHVLCQDGRQLDVKDAKAKELVMQELAGSSLDTECTSPRIMGMQPKASKMKELVDKKASHPVQVSGT